MVKTSVMKELYLERKDSVISWLKEKVEIVFKVCFVIWFFVLTLSWKAKNSKINWLFV